MGCLVGAVAWGRADYVGSDGAAPRYATLLVPLGCWLYFLWGRYGGASGGPAAQMALFLLAAVTFAPNLRAAFDAGHGRRLVLRSFEADLAAGIPPALLAERGAGRVLPAEGRDYLAACLAMLRDARAGAFRRLPQDRPLREAALPASALSWRDMALAGGAARPAGTDPALEVVLPRTEFVCAIRLHYAYTNLLGSPDLFDVWWRGGGRGPKVLLEAGPLDDGDRTVTVWVNDRIDGLRLVPRMKMFALRVSAVEVLLPDQARCGEPSSFCR
jgi:hypothetical protein